MNDGSSDGTAQVLDGLTVPNLHVVHHANNQGYGAALYSGFTAATGRWTSTGLGQTISTNRFSPGLGSTS